MNLKISLNLLNSFLIISGCGKSTKIEGDSLISAVIDYFYLHLNKKQPLFFFCHATI